MSAHDHGANVAPDGGNRTYDIAVIGRGSAAWGAIAEAGRWGASTAFLEHADPHAAQPRAGGEQAQLPRLLPGKSVAPSLHVPDCAVWALVDGTDITLSVRQRRARVRARRVVVADPPRPRVVPFPGWELERVQFVADARAAADAVVARTTTRAPVVLAGAGAALYDTLVDVARRGAPAPIVVDATSADLPAYPAGPTLVGEVRGRTRIVAARGVGTVEAVITVGLTRTGATVPGSERTIPARSVICTFGGLPSVRLASSAGCGVVFDQARQAWMVNCGRDRQSSVRTVYVAGDTGEPTLDYWQGELAGAAAAASLEEGPDSALWGRVESLARALEEAVPTAQPAPPFPDLRDILAESDGLMICPCERVHLADIRGAVRHGFTEVDDVKKVTGCSMGRCQGAACELLLTASVGLLTGRDVSRVGPLKPRLLASVVTLGEVAAVGD